jgi:glucuronate isomerase
MGQLGNAAMRQFLDERFLLETETAQRLYERFAAPEPILDYHCHLSPADIASNRRFETLADIWLEGDHYKWRAMRANGVDERLCTGDAPPYEKFLAWASTVPRCVRNPLYHWTHLELRRCFGIEELLNESTAERIWNRANERLQSGALDTHTILDKFRVRVVCTTDDPADDLSAHERIAASGLATRVYPAFRPDRALDVDQPHVFNAWVDRLGAAADVDVSSFEDFLNALARRHQAFHDAGGRLSDHGLAQCFAEPVDDRRAAAVFDKARGGQPADPTEHAQFGTFLMLFFGLLDAKKGWTKQLHLGARRNASTHGLRSIGRDAGYDSIGDWPQADRLGTYLDLLDREGALPKTILYNVNPRDNYLFASMAGNFQRGETPGKVQFGSGWWYLDQKEGIEWQINALSNVGLLARFVGMTTDSRSFLSYPRHEYFRRILCNLLGHDIERGELPDDEALVGTLVSDVCYRNAERYFGFGGQV